MIQIIVKETSFSLKYYKLNHRQKRVRHKEKPPNHSLKIVTLILFAYKIIKKKKCSLKKSL